MLFNSLFSSFQFYSRSSEISRKIESVLSSIAFNSIVDHHNYEEVMNNIRKALLSIL